MLSIGSFSLGTTAGIIIGSFINHMFAKSRSNEDFKRANFQRVCDNLTLAFSTELIRLGPENLNDFDPYDMPKEAFEKHQAAVFLFKRHLSKANQKKFEKAWFEYSCHEGHPNYIFIEQYNSDFGSYEEKQERRKLAYERIEKILDFTALNKSL